MSEPRGFWHGFIGEVVYLHAVAFMIAFMVTSIAVCMVRALFLWTIGKEV